MKTHLAFLLLFVPKLWSAHELPIFDTGGLVDEIAKKIPPRASRTVALEKTRKILCDKYGITREQTINAVAEGVPIFDSYTLKRPRKSIQTKFDYVVTMRAKMRIKPQCQLQ